MTLKCDLDLGLIRKNILNGTSTHGGEHPCQIMLKSVSKCRSYAPDKATRKFVQIDARRPDELHQNNIPSAYRSGIKTYDDCPPTPIILAKFHVFQCILAFSPTKHGHKALSKQKPGFSPFVKRLLKTQREKILVSQLLSKN